VFHLDFWDLFGERKPRTNHRRRFATREEHVGCWLLYVWKLLHGMVLNPCSSFCLFFPQRASISSLCVYDNFLRGYPSYWSIFTNNR